MTVQVSAIGRGCENTLANKKITEFEIRDNSLLPTCVKKKTDRYLMKTELIEGETTSIHYFSMTATVLKIS
jgi:hypothetical protein